MPGITRERHNEIQDAAMKIVASYGIARLDAIEGLTARNAIIGGWAHQLAAEQGITYETARRHVTRAIRRQRHPDWQPASWGGTRDGAGRPSE